MSANTKNIHNELTLERLNQLAAQETTPSERPGALLLEDIHTAPGVFQRRRPGRYEEERVVADIVQDLNTNPPRLPEPILVRAVGSRFFVVDGHHRLDAYRKVNWKSAVPVTQFTGTLKEAWRQSLKSNVLNKIHMSQEEKSEAAFRAYVAGERDPDWQLTWAEIAHDAHINRRTVARMAAAVKSVGLEEAERSTWKEVQAALRGQQHETLDAAECDQWKQEAARRIASHIEKGPSLTKDPEITAMALEMVSTMLPGQLAAQWGDTARDQVRAEVWEYAPERMDQIEEALEAVDAAVEQAFHTAL